jgi:hypothetical protein
MSNVSSNPLDQLSPHRVIQSVKRWWVIPTGLAVLGVLFGALAGASIRPSAEALVSVTSRSSMDAGTMARIMETTVHQVRAPVVFERAATTLGDSVSSDDLRDRTRISVVATSQVLAIQVVAATTEDAIRQTDAVVDAVLIEQQAARLVALTRVTQSVRGLMRSADSRVQDKDAEQARLVRLGAALADSQSTVVTGDVNLEALQSAQSAKLSAGAGTLALFCGLGGGLLGVAIALLLGVRRGGVRDLNDLAQLHRHLPVIDRRDLHDVLAIEGGTIETIIFAGVLADRERLASLREEVAAQLASSSQTGELTLLASELNDTVLRRANSDPSTLVLVAVDPRTLRLEWLGRRLDELTTRAYLMELPPWPT